MCIQFFVRNLVYLHAHAATPLHTHKYTQIQRTGALNVVRLNSNSRGVFPNRSAETAPVHRARASNACALILPKSLSFSLSLSLFFSFSLSLSLPLSSSSNRLQTFQRLWNRH